MRPFALSSPTLPPLFMHERTSCSLGVLFSTSLHESGVSCISNGKAYKKYEFGAKASVTMPKTKTSGIIIVGVLSFQDNPFDRSHSACGSVSNQNIVGQRPSMEICDRGCRGRRMLSMNSIEIPESGKWTKTASDKHRARERSRRRTVIEPIIGHLKDNHRMLRNSFKGQRWVTS